MKRKYMLFFFLLLIVALLAVNLTRYQEISETATERIYTDRWTGNTWVQSLGNTGTDRTPLKYHENPAALEDMKKMVSAEQSLTLVWYVLMVLSMSGLAYVLIKKKAKTQA